MFNLFETEHGDVFYELIDGSPHIHLQKKGEWAPSIYKFYLKSMYVIRQMFGDDGYEYIYATSAIEDIKLQKFHLLMGFEPYMYIDNAEGQHMALMSRQPTVKE